MLTTLIIGLRQPMMTRALLTVVGSSGSSTRRSMSAALSFPAWAALSKRRRPACAEVP